MPWPPKPSKPQPSLGMGRIFSHKTKRLVCSRVCFACVFCLELFGVVRGGLMSVDKSASALDAQPVCFAASTQTFASHVAARC